MSALGVEEAHLYCPYCGEPISVLVDTSALEGDDGLDNRYIEDCQVCCRPIHLTIRATSLGGFEVFGQDENEV